MLPNNNMQFKGLCRVIIISSLICMSVVIFENDYKKSTLLPLSPLIFLILFLISYFVFRNVDKTITSLIAYVGFFIRMVFSPLMVVITDYDLEIPNNAWIEQINGAVILVVYEYVVFFVFSIASKRIKKVEHYRNEPLIFANEQKINIYTIFIILSSVGFVAYCIIRNPSYVLLFTGLSEFITNTETDIIMKNILYGRMRDQASSLYTLFRTVIVFVQVLIPATLLNTIYKNRTNLRAYNKRKRGVFLSFLVIMLSLIIMSEDYGKTIVLVASIFITLIHVYEKEMKKWTPIFVIGGALGTTFLLLVKVGVFLGRSNGLSTFARIINTYFAGIPNVAVGLTVEYTDKVNTIFGDFFRSIPLLAHFFVDLPRSQELFNLAYHGNAGYLNEIMPTICYGYHYLLFFAPAFTIIIYNACYKIEEKFLRADKMFNKAIYAYILVYFAICPFMYMFTSFLTMWWYSIIFMIIIHLNNEKKRDYNRNQL